MRKVWSTAINRIFKSWARFLILPGAIFFNPVLRLRKGRGEERQEKADRRHGRHVDPDGVYDG